MPLESATDSATVCFISYITYYFTLSATDICREGVKDEMSQETYQIVYTIYSSGDTG